MAEKAMTKVKRKSASGGIHKSGTDATSVVKWVVTATKSAEGGAAKATQVRRSSQVVWRNAVSFGAWLSFGTAQIDRIKANIKIT